MVGFLIRPQDIHTRSVEFVDSSYLRLPNSRRESRLDVRKLIRGGGGLNEMAEDNSVGREPLPTPPYLPFRTFKSYIESLSSSGIPAKIDRTVLRSRSGSEQTMILASLRYLGLISAD